MDINTEYQKSDDGVDMSLEEIRLLNGMLLGKAVINSVENAFRLRQVDEAYAKWAHDNLPSLDGYVRERDDGWSFRTTGDWVERWRERWYYKNRKIVPPKLSLSPKMAGVWYHDRGSKESHGRVKLDMSSLWRSQDNAIEALDRAGFEAFESFSDVYMRKQVAEEFLDWIELPDTENF